MVFDIKTARPIQSGGFDMKTARPLMPEEKQSFLQSIGQGAISGVKEIGGMATGLAQLPYAAGKSVYDLGKAGIETIQGKQTPGQLGQRLMSGAKQDISALAKPYVHPVESFKERPVGTVIDWATAVYPAAKGLSYTGNAISRGVGLSNEPVTAMVKAIRPNKNNINFVKDVKTALPEIGKVAEETGKKITNIDELNQTIKATKQKVWAQYENILKQTKGKTITIDGNKIADDMVKSIDNRFRTQNPAATKRIEETADTYRRSITPIEAEDFLQSANNELYTFYKKNKVGQRVAETDPTMGHIVKEAQGLRRELYAKLGEISGQNVSGLKKLYGALTNIENESIGRSIVASRQSPLNLAEQVSYPYALAKGIKSVVTGDILGGAESIGQIALTKSIKTANTTDNLIKSVFEQIGKKKNYGSGKMLQPGKLVYKGGK